MSETMSIDSCSQSSSGVDMKDGFDLCDDDDDDDDTADTGGIFVGDFSLRAALASCSFGGTVTFRGGNTRGIVVSGVPCSEASRREVDDRLFNGSGCCRCCCGRFWWTKVVGPKQVTIVAD